MARTATKLREIQAPATNPLWPHQQQSLDFFAARQRALDFSSPGTGKTAVQIRHYADRPKASRKRWLVVCPKTLMVAAWGEDIEKFAPELTVSFAFAENREAAFLAKTDVVVINTDGVKWLTEKKNEKYLKEFDHLTIDEVSSFKHPSSQRTKAMVKLRKHFTYRYAMSGTPNPNTVMELFVPALIVEDGKRLGTSYSRMRAVMQQPEQIGPGIDHLKWSDKPGANQAVNELLADITIRHAFEDVMTHVPPNHKHTVHFELSKKARKAYETMATECLLAFGEDVVNAVHAASLRTKLLQIASGAVYDSAGGYKVVDDTRYELIADMVEDREHSVVFFNWHHQRDLLVKHFAARKISHAVIDGTVAQKVRDEIVAEYQAGEYQTILLHPRTGAHGLTLTCGDTTIFSSPLYEADLMEQGLARVYRGAQNKVTNTVFVEAKNTVEQVVYARLHDKNASMQDLLQLMRDQHK